MTELNDSAHQMKLGTAASLLGREINPIRQQAVKKAFRYVCGIPIDEVDPKSNYILTASGINADDYFFEAEDEIGTWVIKDPTFLNGLGRGIERRCFRPVLNFFCLGDEPLSDPGGICATLFFRQLLFTNYTVDAVYTLICLISIFIIANNNLTNDCRYY